MRACLVSAQQRSQGADQRPGRMAFAALVLAAGTCLAMAARDAAAQSAGEMRQPLAEPAVVPATPALESMLERIKADLANRKSAAPAEIRTVSAAAVVWRDTSMGCGKPNESHAQIDVEGYEIVLEHGGARYDYRARKDGTFVLCE